MCWSQKAQHKAPASETNDRSALPINPVESTALRMREERQAPLCPDPAGAGSGTADSLAGSNPGVSVRNQPSRCIFASAHSTTREGNRRVSRDFQRGLPAYFETLRCNHIAGTRHASRSDSAIPRARPTRHDPNLCRLHPCDDQGQLSAGIVPLTGPCNAGEEHLFSNPPRF